MGQFKELKGGYLDINLFLKGGKIIPFQNKTNITSTNDLRNIRTSLIINPDHNKQANGYVIYDSDDIDPIANKTYLHVGINFNKDIIKFFLVNIGIKNNNNIDDIVEDIIIYRASELNAKIYQYAAIETYYGKNERVKMEYKKENDILIIKYIQIPIYIITSIKLE